MYTFETLLSVSLDTYTKVELLDHRVILFFIFEQKRRCTRPFQITDSSISGAFVCLVSGHSSVADSTPLICLMAER